MESYLLSKFEKWGFVIVYAASPVIDEMSFSADYYRSQESILFNTLNFFEI